MPRNDLAKRAARSFMGSGFVEADRREEADPETGDLLVAWLFVMNHPEDPQHERIAHLLIRRARRRGLIAA